ncbi:MAG: hypothetical protein L3J41_12365, partial [Melioribacteraceae bacterium]|nr:hypothetical protein [Melioribacteraceae bacterium]
MKNIKLLIGFILFFTLLSMSDVAAQRWGIIMDGGRFMWRIEPKNHTKAWTIPTVNGIYPGDYREDPGYLNNMHGVHNIFLTDDDKEHPWNPFVSGVSTFTFGGAEVDGQIKYMRYAYPIITVDGVNAGRYQDPTFIVDPDLDCEMKGTNRARTLLGLTMYTTTYTWSHPEYQDIVINHQQIINEGYWYKWFDPVQEDTLSPNHYKAIWIKMQRRYVPGYHSEAFPEGIQEINWNFWGNGVTDGITDPSEILMYQWNPDNKETPLEDEGEWHEGNQSFYFPYYFGHGFLHADGRLMESDKITSPLHWWGIETYPHSLANTDLISFKAFLQARYKYGVDPGLFQPESGYSNPHYRNPDGDTEKTFLANGWYDAKMHYYFGPFESEVGDTINLWVTHLAGGIEPQEADTLGKIWGEKYDPNTYPAGWSDEDIAWKNDIIRTAGVNDMVGNYQKAREIFANDMKIPKMNLVPPAWINITSEPGSIGIEWGSVAGAVSYNIYRGEGDIERLLYDSLSNVNGSVTSYYDSSAVRNFTYYYYVTAVDEDGIESSHFVVRPNIGASPTTFTG